jgi:hypothetical protein
MRGDQAFTRSMIADSASDALLFAALAVIAAIGAGTWLTGQLAALLFRGRWLPAGFPAALGAALRLPGHLADPRQAWPAPVRQDLPGLPGFAVAAMLSGAALGAAAVLVARGRARRYPHRGFASRRDLRVTLSERAVAARGPAVRPTLARAKRIRVEDAGPWSPASGRTCCSPPRSRAAPAGRSPSWRPPG